MSLYDSNVVDIKSVQESTRVRRHLEKSDYIQRKLAELQEETGSPDLDDTTSRAIVKYQSRLLISTLFEKVNMALSHIDEEALQAASLKDVTAMTVGMIGRIDTLMTMLERLAKIDGSEMDQFITKLRSMGREEAMLYLRQEFETVFSTLFTDSERNQVFKDLDDQVALDRLGVLDGEDSDANVRAAPDGKAVGSSRWVPKSGPPGVLPPPSGAD